MCSVQPAGTDGRAAKLPVGGRCREEGTAPPPPALADYSINHKQTRRGARPPALRKSLGSGETCLQLQSTPPPGEGPAVPGLCRAGVSGPQSGILGSLAERDPRITKWRSLSATLLGE